LNEFPDKGWKLGSIDYLSKKIRKTGTVNRQPGSGRPRLARTDKNIETVDDTIQLLQTETPDFIGPDLWPPNSPVPNPVDYKIWGVMQQRVYESRINSVDELQERLHDVWHGVQQHIIDLAVSQWRQRLTACVRAHGRHFEHLL